MHKKIIAIALAILAIILLGLACGVPASTGYDTNYGITEDRIIRNGELIGTWRMTPEGAATTSRYLSDFTHSSYEWWNQWIRTFQRHRMPLFRTLALRADGSCSVSIEPNWLPVNSPTPDKVANEPPPTPFPSDAPDNLPSLNVVSCSWAPPSTTPVPIRPETYYFPPLQVSVLYQSHFTAYYDFQIGKDKYLFYERPYLFYSFSAAPDYWPGPRLEVQFRKDY